MTGRERLGWDQSGSSLAELDTVGFNLYVDDQRGRLNGVACSAGATPTTFLCQAPLPFMTSGAHSLQLTSFYLADPANESAKSGALQLVVAGIVTGGGELTSAPSASAAPSSSPQSAALKSEAAWPASLVRVATGLDRPSDLAFTPDSRLWIAERSGRVRVLKDGAIVADPALVMAQRAGAGAVVSIAVDPQFASNHFIFAIYTDRSRTGRLTFAIARYREAADTLGDRVVILDEIPASPDARASLRFGADGKLYAAFDDGGDARSLDDPASFNGKILRLNANGTTPDDAPRKSPVFSVGPASPRGIAWHRASGHLWTADKSSVGKWNWTSPPESIAAVRDELFVGSDPGLIRAQMDRGDPSRLTGLRDLAPHLTIRAVAASPDGVVYVATETAIGRLQ